MKRLLILALLVGAESAGAQTLDDARLAHNATACEALSLDSKCTDAAAAAAWTAANGGAERPVERQVFATITSYRDAVILPPIIKAKLAARRATFADKVYNAIMTDAAKCIEIATVVGVDAAVCK